MMVTPDPLNSKTMVYLPKIEEEEEKELTVLDAQSLNHTFGPHFSKLEEKELKKVRRRIKNKISAQESRRRKKEYIDSLENRARLKDRENDELKKKIESLEDKMRSLVDEMFRIRQASMDALRSSATNSFLKQTKLVTRATQTGMCLQCHLEDTTAFHAKTSESPFTQRYVTPSYGRISHDFNVQNGDDRFRDGRLNGKIMNESPNKMSRERAFNVNGSANFHPFGIQHVLKVEGDELDIGTVSYHYVHHPDVRRHVHNKSNAEIPTKEPKINSHVAYRTENVIVMKDPPIRGGRVTITSDNEVAKGRIINDFSNRSCVDDKSHVYHGDKSLPNSTMASSVVGPINHNINEVSPTLSPITKEHDEEVNVISEAESDFSDTTHDEVFTNLEHETPTKIKAANDKSRGKNIVAEERSNEKEMDLNREAGINVALYALGKDNTENDSRKRAFSQETASYEYLDNEKSSISTKSVEALKKRHHSDPVSDRLIDKQNGKLAGREGPPSKRPPNQQRIPELITLTTINVNSDDDFKSPFEKNSDQRVAMSQDLLIEEQYGMPEESDFAIQNIENQDSHVSVIVNEKNIRKEARERLVGEPPSHGSDNKKHSPLLQNEGTETKLHELISSKLDAEKGFHSYIGPTEGPIDARTFREFERSASRKESSSVPSVISRCDDTFRYYSAQEGNRCGRSASCSDIFEPKSNPSTTHTGIFSPIESSARIDECRDPFQSTTALSYNRSVWHGNGDRHSGKPEYKSKARPRGSKRIQTVIGTGEIDIHKSTEAISNIPMTIRTKKAKTQQDIDGKAEVREQQQQQINRGTDTSLKTEPLMYNSLPDAGEQQQQQQNRGTDTSWKNKPLMYKTLPGAKITELSPTRREIRSGEEMPMKFDLVNAKERAFIDTANRMHEMSPRLPQHRWTTPDFSFFNRPMLNTNIPGIPIPRLPPIDGNFLSPIMPISLTYHQTNAWRGTARRDVFASQMEPGRNSEDRQFDER